MKKKSKEYKRFKKFKQNENNSLQYVKELQKQTEKEMDILLKLYK